MKIMIRFFLLSLFFAQGGISATAAPGVLSQLNKSDAAKAPAKRADLRLQDLEKRSELFKKNMYEPDLHPQLEKIVAELDALQKDIKKSSGERREFFKTKLSLTSQNYQILAELEQVQQHLTNTIETQIKLWQEYASDETFESVKIPEKTQYNFDEIQQLAQKIVEIKAQYAEAEKNKLAVIDDTNKRKKTLALIQDEIKEKRKQQETFVEQLKGDEPARPATAAQRGEVIDGEAQLLESKKKLAELKIAEAEQRLSLIEDEMHIDKAQLSVLRKEYNRIKDAVHVKVPDVKKEESQLEAKRQSSVSRIDRLSDKKRVLLSEEIGLKQKIQEAQQKFEISASDVAAIRLLDKEPKNSKEWVSFVTILHALFEKTIHDIERDSIDAQMDLEKAQFNKDELDLAIVRTWHKMTSEQSGFKTDEEVDQEIKKYSLEKTELEAHIAALTNARDTVINQLQRENALLEKIKPLNKLLHDQRTTVLKGQPDIYDFSVQTMFNIEEQKRRQLQLLAKLMETYATTIAAVQNNVKKVESVIDELKSKSFWRKSEQSIRWNKLRNFIPDVRQFLADLWRSAINFFSAKRVAQFLTFLSGLVEEPLKLLHILVNLIIIAIVYLLLRLYLPDLINYLQSIARNYASLRYFALLGAIGLQFAVSHLHSMYAWAVLFVLFFTHTIHDAFLAQVFYLASIPYLLVLAQHFFAYFEQVNRQRYTFISEAYQERFFWTVSKLTYAAIVLLALRQAFDLGGYRGSQVPNVLMALLFLLCQATLISLIRREQILNALRIDTPLGEWIYDHVNKYYYFLLAAVIGVIVVSNPYIGHGRQIISILSRSLLIAILIPLFSWIYSRVKGVSVDLFFYYTDNDEIKERFIAGRFWYGCFVISSLSLFLVTGVYFAGRIWGTRLTLHDMASWLNYSFYEIINDAGQPASVTIFSLLHIVFFIVGGIIVATIINKFILRRALDPFLVEPGIQSTVLTLIRYIIVIIAAFMGLKYAGLGELTTKLAIILAGIGFAAQETVRDFFSYFILLVQRTIKIGDLIEVGDNTGNRDNAIVGVVRHITPRSIMIRQRNSVTVIIPNSRVVMHPVINWSYSRSFIAFNDIFVTIPFGCDPNFVRQLLFQVLDKNIQLLKTPAPIVRLEDFTDNGYRFLIRGFLTSDKALDQWDVASDVRLELVKQLRAHGIQIASPVRTLKVVAPDQYDPFTQQLDKKP